MSQVHHRYATVNGRQLFYREAGPADAPALVLLHGFPTSSFMLRDLIPQFGRPLPGDRPGPPRLRLSDAAPAEESWQQGPLGGAPVGRFLTPDPLPQRLLFAEPLRRRMRVQFAGEWIADSENVLLLHEPGHYPVALFPLADDRPGVLVSENRTTQHRELGDTGWFTVTARRPNRWPQRLAVHRPTRPRQRAARPCRVRLASDGRLLRGGRTHRRARRRPLPPHRHPPELTPPGRHRRRAGHRRHHPPGRAIRIWIRTALVRAARGHRREPADPGSGTNVLPYKGLASYYDIGDRTGAAWSYPQAWPDVARVSDLVSFEPDKVDVFLDDKKLALEPGQAVIPHGIDRGLGPDEILNRGNTPAPA